MRKKPIHFFEQIKQNQTRKNSQSNSKNRSEPTQNRSNLRWTKTFLTWKFKINKEKISKNNVCIKKWKNFMKLKHWISWISQRISVKVKRKNLLTVKWLLWEETWTYRLCLKWLMKRSLFPRLFSLFHLMESPSFLKYRNRKFLIKFIR